MNTKDFEIYIHIPFCVKKCHYCDFLSAPADENTINEYVERLKEEVTLRSEKTGRVTSIFFGGGTPTRLTGKQLSDIISCLRDNFNVSEEAEITLECNPKTADLEKLKICREAGFNRISIGLQSALDEELTKIGRIHTYDDFLSTYYGAVEAGFTNINVDLITALPEQCGEDVSATLDRVLALNPRPKHISSYSLILEENTRFWEMNQAGMLELPDEDVERELHWLVIDKLAKEGYGQYELSNISLPGYECKHNIGYWTGVDYIGMGLGASSLWDGKRLVNADNLKDYLSGDFEREVEAELTEEDKKSEFMFLGLRLTKGISDSEFLQRFGHSLEEVYGKELDKNVKDGLLEKTAYGYRLSRRGQDLANYVFAQFI